MGESFTLIGFALLGPRANSHNVVEFFDRLATERGERGQHNPLEQSDLWDEDQD